MRFDVSDLRIFKAVVDLATMTKAASRVHLTVASVSERIKQMEDQVGVPLLSRSRSGIVATEAGRVLMHHAVKVLRQVDFMNEDLASFTRRLRTNVRLYTTTYAVSEILPDAAPAFFASNPNSDLVIEEQHSEDIAFAVSSGAAEIGIIGEFVETGSLEIIPLLEDSLVAFTGNNFATEVQSRCAFADLLPYDFLGLGPGSRLQEQLESHAREAGAPMRYRARTRNLDAICRLVSNNVGIAVVPRRVAARFNGNGCRIIELTDEWKAYNTSAVVQSRSDLPSTAASLLECLIDAAS